MPLNKVVTRRFTVTLKELTLEAGMELASFHLTLSIKARLGFWKALLRALKVTWST